ncbi:amino acid adenylation domain-containing protein [Rhizobium leguminosarum]
MDKSTDNREELLRLLLEEEPDFVSPLEEHDGSTLSFSQKRIWFLRQLLGDVDISYNVPFSLRLRGRLDHAALQLSVNEIVARHDVLRARFELLNGRPVQYIADELPIAVEVLTPRPEMIAGVVAGHAQHVFDLASAPLLKVSLLRIAEDDHVLLLNMHHIVADGWSLGVFVSEVSRLYRNAVFGETAKLPRLPIQYPEFSESQSNLVTSGAFDSQLQYWLKQLRDAPATISLPIDSPRPEKMSGRGGQVKFVISGELRDGLRALSAKGGATLFMVLMSAYFILLNRLGGDEDILVGTPVAGRPNQDVENLIGCFVNTVVIRSHMRPDDCVSEVIERVKSTSLDAFENQDLPFEVLVEHLRPERSLGKTPVFQAMIALQNIPISEFDLPGITIEPFTQSLSISKFDLNMNLSERETGISAILEYNSDIFAASNVEKMARGYQEILSDILTAGPTKRVRDIAAPSLHALLRPSLTNTESTDSRSEQEGWLHYFCDGFSPYQLPRVLPPRSGEEESRFDAIEVSISSELFTQIEGLAKRYGSGLHEILFAVLLSISQRFLDDADAVVGICEPPERGADAEIADWAWSVLRLEGNGAQAFEHVLLWTSAHCQRTRSNYLTSTQALKLQPTGGARITLFPITASRFDIGDQASAFACISPLHFAFIDRDRHIDARIQFDTAVFTQRDVEAICSLFLSFLRRVLSDPSRPLQAIGLLDENERGFLLSSYRAELVQPAKEASLAAPFESYAKQHPNDTALLCEGLAISYSALNKRSSQVAHFVRALGFGEGARIAVCMQAGVGLIETLYAVAKMGAIYVPIDSDFPKARLVDMLNNLSVPIILTDRASRASLPEGDWKIEILEDHANAIADKNDDPITLHRRSGAACYIMHTSGSSGLPKAVQFPTDVAIMSMRSLQSRYPVEPGDVHIFKTPFTFDVSIWEIFWPLYYGGKLVIGRPTGHRDLTYLRELIEANGVTLVNIVPSLLDSFLCQVPQRACPSLRWIFSGGERLSPATRNRCFETLPHSRLVNLYGPTETHAVADEELSREVKGDYVPIGHPSAAFQLYVLDNNFEPVPMGVVGELFIGNPVGVAHGYIGQPALTAECFVPDPFGLSGGRLYRTGDLCRYYSNGELEYVGRRDRQLKVGGIRIEPGEIEMAFLSRPEVAQCVVTSIGEGSSRRLLAYIVLDAKAKCECNEIGQHTAAILPRHLVPSEIVAVTAIPTTPNGKVDLAGLDRERTRQLEASINQAISGTLETATERCVYELFEEVLNRSGIDPAVSFFELGGHSLMAIQALTRCQTEFSVKLPLQLMYTANSVKALAAAIDSVREIQAQALVPLACTGSREDTPAIVFIHGADGTVAPFLALAQRMGRRFDIFALQAPSIDNVGELCRTVPAYVEYYLPLVLSLRQTREIVLIGWSFGGNVAVEIARDLNAANLPPLHTILLDSFVISGRSRAESAYEALNRFDYPAIKALQQLDGAGEAAECIRRVLDNNLHAFVEYVPTPYLAPIHVIKACDGWPGLLGEPAVAYNDRSRGWGDLLPFIEWREVPGDHFSFLASSDGESLAQTILEIIQSTES